MKLHLFILLILMMISGIIVAQEPTYEDCLDTLQTWLDARVENAKEGTREIVEMPMVVRCYGWGCSCPYHYIGVCTYMQHGPWIAPVEAANFPQPDQRGHSLFVTGYFTGEIETEESEGPEEEPFILPVFKVTSWKVNELQEEVLPPRVVEVKSK